jgi:hypothetical protein
VLGCALVFLRYQAAAAGAHPTEPCPALLSLLAPGTQHCAAVKLLCLWPLCRMCPCVPYLTAQGSLYRGLCCAVVSGLRVRERARPRAHVCGCILAGKCRPWWGFWSNGSTLCGEIQGLLMCAAGAVPVAGLVQMRPVPWGPWSAERRCWRHEVSILLGLFVCRFWCVVHSVAHVVAGRVSCQIGDAGHTCDGLAWTQPPPAAPAPVVALDP